MTFEEELKHIINIYSQENESGTPDFILAKYLMDCLDAYNRTIKQREAWYGRELPRTAPAAAKPAKDGEK